MAVDIGLAGISGTIIQWLTSFLFWGIAGIIILVVVFGSLIYKKNKKLRIPIIVRTDLGNGKAAFDLTKGGWFKTQTTFFGLLDFKGEDIFRTKDKRVIQDASSSDYHEINGKMGLLVQRKSDDNKVLVPISKTVLSEDSQKEICSIAPADYRDASNKINESANRETMGFMDKYLPMISWMVMGIIFLIIIILIVQMVKTSQAEAWKNTQEAIAMARTNAQAAIASSAPLILAFKKKWFK